MSSAMSMLTARKRTPYLKLMGKTRVRAWWEVGKGAYQSDSGTGDRAFLQGDPIGFIADLSGNGNHLKQATGGNKPALYTGIVGNLPAARFDGISGHMVTDAAIQAAQTGYVIMVFVLRTALTTGALWNSGNIAASTTHLRFRPRVAVNTSQVSQQNLADTTDAIRFTGINVAIDTPYYVVTGSTGSAYDGLQNGLVLTKAVSTGADTGDWGADCTSLTNFSIGASVSMTTSLYLEHDFIAGAVLEPDVSDHEKIRAQNYFRFDLLNRHI